MAGGCPFVAGFAEVEVDIETGDIRVVDYAAGADAGTIIHPKNFEGQIFGGAIQGFSVALSQKWVYDRRWGLLVAKRFYNNRPPGILDVPHEQPMKWGAANLPDPFNPLGAKGIGEAAQGAGSGAVVNAIADALGQENGDFFRSPIHAGHDPDPAREGAAWARPADGSRLRPRHRRWCCIGGVQAAVSAAAHTAVLALPERTSHWTRIRLFRGRCNRRPAARPFKSRTSAVCIITTNGAPPDRHSQCC